MKSDDDRPILPWRLVAGALIHFIVPAYLATIVVAWLIAGPTGLSPDASLPFVLRISGRFLAAYAALVVAASGAARMIDPLLRARRRRHESGDPAAAAARSERRVRQATQAAEKLGAGADARRIAAAVAILRRGAWRHDDERFQALSADLAEAVRHFAAASATAPSPERHDAIAALAATSLEHVAHALDMLTAEHARLDEGDAQAVARYIEMRYGPSEFTSERS